MVSGSSGARTGRQRSLLPLPLKDDSVEVLKAFLNDGEYRRLAGTTAAKKKEKASKLARKNGLLIWHGLVTGLLNTMWSGGGANAPVHQGPVTTAQPKAQDRLWEAVKIFVDDVSETSDKVPKSPALGEWGKRLGDVRIPYQGEVIEKAQKLTLDQMGCRLKGMVLRWLWQIWLKETSK
eukprot:Skav200291  [mRNA]  locus=scaffold2127:399954:400490:+ [translate_table: standard]